MKNNINEIKLDLSNSSINKKEWVNFNDEELALFANTIFNYYRINGFPYHRVDMESRNKNLETLLRYDHSNIIKDDVITQTMHGLSFAWSFFPHAYEVQCGKKRTPIDVFNDDNLFMECINKRLKMGTYISDSGIRKMLGIFKNTQVVSNFRPSAAAAIYDRFGSNGVVWDMSGGWGGRLVGALKSSVSHYIATEPSIKTYQGLCDMATYINNHISSSKTFNIELENCGSEEYLPEKETLDLCFSSPPYFNLEKYSNEKTQSYIKFPDIDMWIHEFLGKTIENCYYGLKPKGYMVINIADHKRSKFSIENETIRLAKKHGFHLVDTLKLALSNPNMKNRVSAFKYEPVFIFKK